MDSRAVSVEAKKRGSVCCPQYLHVVRKTGPVVSSRGERPPHRLHEMPLGGSHGPGDL